MISFSLVDILIIFLFFIIILAAGFLAGKNKSSTAEDYLLSGRKVGLFLFVLTNVSTWYGGILGVGEFTYRYGLLSWFTQGLPYYIFAFLFAFFFAKKIREASLFTIPDKLEQTYGKKVSLVSAILIFILVSPAPYLLMMGNLISLIFQIDIFWSLIISFILSAIYMFRGGYKSDLYTDAVEFFIMFGGFILIFLVAYFSYGGIDYLQANLPSSHLKLTGGTSITYVIVWFLIAMWTFTDPGFHQRCYAAKSSSIAAKGILISIIFWALFDFLTSGVGLYSRAILPNLENPVLAFPLLAEKILGPGTKGFFYAALFATILSTLNSFLFLSATTFSRDFLFRLSSFRNEEKLKSYTAAGLVVAGLISIIFVYSVPSVIEIWYTIGTICIPGIILPVISSYYVKIKTDSLFVFIEIVASTCGSLFWFFAKEKFVANSFVYQIEPMIIGLIIAIVIHFGSLFHKKFIIKSM